MHSKHKRMLEAGTIFLLLLSSASISIANFNIHTKQNPTNDYILKYVFDEPLLDQYQNETEEDATVPFGVFEDDDIKLAQSFKPSYPILSKVDLLLKKKINSNHVEVSLKESLNSSQSLITVELNNQDISNYPSWTSVIFSDINVIPEKTYYIICSTEASAIFIYEWHHSQLNGQPLDNYDRGMGYTFENGLWSPYDLDFCFKTYGKKNDTIKPVGNFSYVPEDPKISENIIFDASASYDLDGEIMLYKWDWNNDGIYDESHTTPFANYSWIESGSYQVTLQVVDNTNLVGNITKTVNVYDVIVPDDYPTIQGAIDISDNGYRIYVRPGGTYKENIIIDLERLYVQGGDKLNTVIEGLGNSHVVNVLEWAHYVEISGFTIKNSAIGYAGINLQSSYNKIYDNDILENDFGVNIRHSSGNQIVENNLQSNGDAISIHNESFASNILNNTITKSQRNGIYIDNLSNGHVIQKNNIFNNICGIKINGVSKSTVVRENIIQNNHIGVDCIFFSDGNRFFYNSLEKNNINAYDASTDRWDNNMIGNYWDDYTGVDQDGNGIGDTPYFIPGGANKDRYPLMYPWGPPTIPLLPFGQATGKINREYEYSTMSTDPDGDQIKYGWDWNGDKNVDEWTSYYPSGEMVYITHKFTITGGYQVRVIAKDIHNQLSSWSKPINVSISRGLIKDALPFTDYIKYRSINLIYRFKEWLDQNPLFAYKNSNIIKKKQPLIPNIVGKTIYVPNNYKTIQEAINNSNDFDTIIVKPGTYHEHLIVDKKLTIMGQDKNQTIIDGDFAEQHVITIISDNVQIEDFTIQNCKISHSGIRIWKNNNTIANNNILNCGGGIEMYWSNGNIIKTNILLNNTFAIFFSDSTNCLVDDNIIMNNQNGIESGLTLKGFEKTSIQLEKNVIDTNIEHGILLLQTDDMIIGNNTIKNHSLIGTEVFSGRNTRFFSNKFFENAKGITLHDSQNITILSNIFTSNFPFFTYHDTLLLSSDMGICILFKSDHNLVNDNCFENWCNAYDMCLNTYDIDSNGNYWDGCYTGKDLNGDGIGDTPYQIQGGNNLDRYPLMDCPLT